VLQTEVALLREEEVPVTIDRGLGAPCSLPGHWSRGESPAFARNRTSARRSRSLITILTELFRLQGYAMKKCGGLEAQLQAFNLDTRWKRIVSFTSMQLYPREIAPVHIKLEARWAPEPIWTLRRRKISRSCGESKTSTSVAQPKPNLYAD
jgi:hypothetical protein